MITTVLKYLPHLGIAVVVNILLGTYYNIENLKKEFSLSKLILGIAKALAIGAAFVGLAVVFEKLGLVVNLSDYQLRPDLVLFSAIMLYLGKDIENLMKILGVEEVSVNTDTDISIER